MKITRVELVVTCLLCVLFGYVVCGTLRAARNHEKPQPQLPWRQGFYLHITPDMPVERIQGYIDAINRTMTGPVTIEFKSGHYQAGDIDLIGFVGTVSNRLTFVGTGGVK